MCILQNAMFATLRIICGYTRQSEPTDFGRNFSFKRPGHVCLELPSDSKGQFSLVADEICELVHTTEIAMCATLFVTRSARPALQKHAEFRHNF